MKKKPIRWKPKRVLRLPDLDHAKTAGLTTLGSLSTRPSFSVTGCNSKLAACLHPRSMYVWLRFVVSPTKRLIAVCSAQNLPLAFAELRVPRNSGSGSETGLLHNKEKRFSAFLPETRSGASETLRCWHCCS